MCVLCIEKGTEQADDIKSIVVLYYLYDIVYHDSMILQLPSKMVLCCILGLFSPHGSYNTMTPASLKYLVVIARSFRKNRKRLANICSP
jgi:hypothetical protein